MAAVSQWEREAIGERTRDALGHERANGERVGNFGSDIACAPTGGTSSQTLANRRRWQKSAICAKAATPCGGSLPR